MCVLQLAPNDSFSVQLQGAWDDWVPQNETANISANTHFWNANAKNMNNSCLGSADIYQILGNAIFWTVCVFFSTKLDDETVRTFFLKICMPHFHRKYFHFRQNVRLSRLNLIYYVQFSVREFTRLIDYFRLSDYDDRKEGSCWWRKFFLNHFATLLLTKFNTSSAKTVMASWKFE